MGLRLVLPVLAVGAVLLGPVGPAQARTKHTVAKTHRAKARKLKVRKARPAKRRTARRG